MKKTDLQHIADIYVADLAYYYCFNKVTTEIKGSCLHIHGVDKVSLVRFSDNLAQDLGRKGWDVDVWTEGDEILVSDAEREDDDDDDGDDGDNCNTINPLTAYGLALDEIDRQIATLAKSRQMIELARDRYIRSILKNL